MKAVLMVFTLTVLMWCAGSSAIAEIVTINAALLPGPGASYVHCWAAAGSSANKHLPHPRGKTDLTGANITCDAKITHAAGDSASAYARAKVTDGIVLEANVPKPGGLSMKKVTFSAAAAYAQGGGQVKKQGTNKSSLLAVEIDGLKITGKQDPVDDEVALVVSNLKPDQVNYALIKRVVKDRDLLDQILKFDQSGFDPSAQSTSYLEVRAKITAGGEFVVEDSAPLLCDTEKLKKAGVDVHNLSSPSGKVAEAVIHVLAQVEDFCGPQHNVVQTSSFDVKSVKDTKGFQVHVANQTKKLQYVIVIPDNSPENPKGNDISVNTFQFTSTHK